MSQHQPSPNGLRHRLRTLGKALCISGYPLRDEMKLLYLNCFERSLLLLWPPTGCIIPVIFREAMLGGFWD